MVRSSWGKENFELDNPNKNVDTVEARSWITLDTAKKLLADCGRNFDALKKSALTKEFRPVSLKATAYIEIKQQIRSFKSHNVIGKLEGGDPKLNGEYIIYTAHWDHLGRHPELQGDQIFNGAIDNASGVASVIVLGGAFTKLNPTPKRSVLFMATTAEEAGLLGAKYYTQHPLYPLEKTLADINIDGVNPWGKTRDLEDLTGGNSPLDDFLGKAAVQLRTSYGDRTSPVLRGAWVLDKLMGTPPTPPPPDTATDLSQKAGEQPKTVRARLEQHRDKASCRMCHGVIDPTGLALENFDAIGQWRTMDSEANAPIDASTVLPTGVAINGVVELRAQLVARPEVFAQTVTERLLMYAVNRQLEYFDMPQVRAIVRAAAKENYKLSSIILGIVNSDAFRKQAAN